ncbi:hypothetical protein E2C01_062226 [Portunus trituberculatus]|uniref:Uncharacterized protein n=1 Tax=Portunus trituberculatus TaxID=210409 RepID=A0A5B7HDG7_PORTR|nr:hypothetical protein [Portunus trituberculatus]
MSQLAGVGTEGDVCRVRSEPASRPDPSSKQIQCILPARRVEEGGEARPSSFPSPHVWMHLTAPCIGERPNL